MLYIALAMGLFFVTGVLAVVGGGEWAVERLTEKRGVYEAVVGKELHRLFLDTSPKQFIFAHLLSVMAAVGLGYVLLGGILGVIVGAVVGTIGPRMWLKRKWQERVDKVDDQVEEAVVYMANSFKANPSLPEAIKDVTLSMGAPISEELSVMLREYQLGTPLDEALINLQRRVPARNLELAISAIRIGRTVGGNIPDILEDIASTIRESHRLEQVIDTQTAQGRMQAWVMGSMPLVVCGAFYMLDPSLIRPLFETFAGYFILGIAVVLNLIGVWLILKILSIRV